MADIDRNGNNPIKFCHIAPSSMLGRYTQTNGAHLLLAHLIEDDYFGDNRYTNYYANLNDGKLKIMDNSAFEMFKQGRPMYDSDKLIEMAKRVKADVIVMSDYPKEEWTKTRDKAIEMIPKLKDAGFKTFYVPQSELNDLQGAVLSFEWALNNPDVDLIGVSILTCPIAFGVNESKHDPNFVRSDAYKLQRFMSRWKMFTTLQRNGLLWDDKSIKRFHVLGMTDGPNEIELLQETGFAECIHSWDSSAAVWAGMNGIGFDESPTGLMEGKFETEVDFNCFEVSTLNDNLALSNIRYIDRLCQGL